MKYLLVKAQNDLDLDLKAFTEAINQQLEKGWEPQGGLCISPTGAVYQALIKD